MPTAYALLALSAYLVLVLLAPFYDPNTLPPFLRLALLLSGTALVVGVIGFLVTFTRPTIPAPQEDV